MKRVLYLALMVAVAASAQTTFGDNYTVQGPFSLPAPGPGLPGPGNVPGKEFTQNIDKDAFGVPDPGQVLNFDGAGGTANGAYDYIGADTYGVGVPNIHATGEIDGLANNTDALFNELRNNTSHLIFGVQNNGAYLYEKTDGSKGVWATPAQIDSLTPPTSAHDLEIWGNEVGDDANRYSLKGGPGLSDPGGIAVYNAGGGVEYTDSELASAIRTLTGRLDINNADLANALDLDAMMTLDIDAETKSLIFSVAPLSVGPKANPLTLDGGEIFVYDVTAGGDFISYLNHGGHLWDTAYDVTGLGFGGENVTALEAASTSVPEPTTIAMLGTAGLGLLIRRKRS